MNISKNRKNLIEKIDLKKSYDPIEAIKILKENSYVKFNESLEIAINLKIDAEKTDQNIRGVINLPKGTGKKIKIAVMTKGDSATEAKESGADIVGDDDLVKEISSGKIDFDLLIASPDMMPSIGKVGKILGPKGLMPNPKLGTVTNDIKKAVAEAKAGQVEIRNDKDGNIGVSIGKKSFSDENLIKNYKAVIDTLEKEKSNLNVKGDLIKQVFITSTMGVSYKLKLEKSF